MEVTEQLACHLRMIAVWLLQAMDFAKVFLDMANDHVWPFGHAPVCMWFIAREFGARVHCRDAHHRGLRLRKAFNAGYAPTGYAVGAASWMRSVLGPGQSCESPSIHSVSMHACIPIAFKAFKDIEALREAGFGRGFGRLV